MARERTGGDTFCRMALLSRGVPETNAWRTSAPPVIAALQAYGQALDTFRRAMAGRQSNLPEGAVADLSAASQRSEDALNAWIRANAPGSDAVFTKRDPSRGGFSALSIAFGEAFDALTLGHLTHLGVTLYAELVGEDGRGQEVVAAMMPASEWFHATLSFADLLASNGEPRGAAFIVAWRPMGRFQSVRESHASLVPYLMGMDERMRT